MYHAGISNVVLQGQLIRVVHIIFFNRCIYRIFFKDIIVHLPNFAGSVNRLSVHIFQNRFHTAWAYIAIFAHKFGLDLVIVLGLNALLHFFAHIRLLPVMDVAHGIVIGQFPSIR